MKRARDGTAYSLDGPPGAPAVALIHGLGLTHSTWQWHAPALGRRHRVLQYDLYGHGASPLPERPSLALFARQLRDLMDELEIADAALVGFSLGGMINRRFARDYPERVLALVILNSPHERSPEAQRQVEERASASAARGPGADLDATIDRWFTREFQSRNPAVVDDIRAWVLANDPDSYALCRRVLAFGVKELVRPATPVSHPCLVMTAENDVGSTPSMAAAIAAQIPGAETRIVPDLRHMALVESPEAFTGPMLAFLHRTLRPRGTGPDPAHDDLATLATAMKSDNTPG